MRLAFSLQTLFAVVTISSMFLGGYCLARQGSPLQKTGKPLDLAIVGDGYFQIQLENVERKFYTRFGHFHLNASGDLVSGTSTEPRRLFPNVTFPQGATPVIGTSGNVMYYFAGQPELMNDMGTIQIATFANPSGLRQVADDLYEATDESGQPTPTEAGRYNTGLIRSGYLERPLSEIWLADVKPLHVLLMGFLVAGGLLLLRELRAQRLELARIQHSLSAR